VALNAPVLCEPFKALLPLQPPAPAHDVVLDEVQLSRALAPLATDDGVAVRLATGSTWIVTLTIVLVPFEPAHVRE
jgi:hypothetical protein